MSFISTGVEYGLHCLLYLARPRFGAEGASVRDLAELQGISTEYLAKLFTKLAKADLVSSTQGVRGGYRLARPPESITVNDVIVAIDGDKPLFDCREIRGRSALFEDAPPAWATRGVCSIDAVMKSAESAMRAELERHSLAQLADRTLDKAPAGYGPKIVRWLSTRSSNRTGAQDDEDSQPAARRRT